jgi:two-component system sensor histidine kinase/response regulator
LAADAVNITELARVVIAALAGFALAWAVARKRRPAGIPGIALPAGPDGRDSRALAEALPQIVWMADLKGGIEFANQQWFAYSGLTPEQTYPHGWRLVVHPDDADSCLARWSHSLESGQPFETEYRLHRADGVYRWHLARALPVRAADGTVARWIGTSTDIHDQKDAVEAIRRSELVFQHSSWGVLIMDGDSLRVSGANPAFERMHGYGPGEMLGTVLEDHSAPEAREQVAAQTALVDHDGRVVFESLHLRRDGSTFPVLVDVTSVKDADGRVRYRIANHLDLTENHAAELARERAELRFRAVQDASPDVILLWDIQARDGVIVDGTLTYANPAAERLLRRTRAELAGQPMTALFPDVRATGRMDIYSEVYRTGVTRDITLYHETFRSWLRLVVIKVGDGLGVISTDVTGSKNAEAVLRRSRDELEQLVTERTRELHNARDLAVQANRAKSDILSRASHELRTPLSSVIGFSNILLKNKRGALAEEELTYLARIAKNGRNLLALVNDLLDLSKIEAGRVDLELSPVSLFDVLHEVKETLAPRAAELGLTLEVEVSLENDLVIADEARLRQVLVNLAGNAIKYTTAGSVRVRVLCNSAGAPARIDVVDTGPGIAPDRLDAIFQPFIVDATPAAGDAATGLGLAITRALCDLMGYRLTVESHVGAGSTFSVHLLAQEAVRLRQIA